MVDPDLYYEELIYRGLSPSAASAVVTKSMSLIASGRPQILTLGNISFATGVPYDYLHRVVERKLNPYTTFRMRKRSGGFREICAPDANIYRVQRFILDRVLNRQRPHHSSFAYERGSSASKAARKHVGCRWLIKTDIKDFFGSINEAQCFEIFAELGFGRLVAFEMARLVTRVPDDDFNCGDHSLSDAGFPYPSAPPGVLPQGAATSGKISNLVTRELDSRILSLAHSQDMTYTRYSDDIVLSSRNANFNTANARNALRSLGQILTDCGFVVNGKKSTIVPPGARKIVLGMVVGDKGIHVSPEFKFKLDLQFHSVEKFGIINSADYFGFQGPLSLIYHIEGKLRYAWDVNPRWAAKATRRWERLSEAGDFPRFASPTRIRYMS